MNKKKGLILTIIALLTLTIFVVGATYAYFSAQGGSSTSIDIKANTATTDVLTFAVDKSLNISASQRTFGEGMDNASDTAIASATLTANNSTNSAEAYYSLYLDISENTFVQSGVNPEILLNVTDSDGNELTLINGLTYFGESDKLTDSKGNIVKGFDITTKSGFVNIKKLKKIVAGTESTVKKETNEEKWTITITFVNYDADQSKNAGAAFKAEILIQKEEKTTLETICKSGQNLSECIIATAESDDTLYYHDSSLANGAGDNSYRYTGTNGHPAYYSCTYDGNDVLNFEYHDNITSEGDCSIVYKASFNDGEEDITEYFDNSFEKYFYNTTSVKWDSTNNKCVTESSIEVTDFSRNSVTEEKCVGTAYQYMDEELYALGITKLGAGVETLVSEAVEGVNNYVCFGSDDDTCPTENLYRIIGVIDGKVKLIKATSLGDMAWDSNGSNTWSTSSLNTYLNGTYLNTFSEDWQSKIATTTWKVGGISSGSVTASTMYTNEMNSTTSGKDGLTEYSSKVALMYAHDYGFAASPTAWTTTLVNYDGNDSTGTSITTNDWLYLGSLEWLVSRYSSDSTISYRVGLGGNVYYSRVASSYAVRPVLFLESTATYSDGTGTSDNPYRLG